MEGKLVEQNATQDGLPNPDQYLQQIQVDKLNNMAPWIGFETQKCVSKQFQREEQLSSTQQIQQESKDPLQYLQQIEVDKLNNMTLWIGFETQKCVSKQLEKEEQLNNPQKIQQQSKNPLKTKSEDIKHENMSLSGKSKSKSQPTSQNI